MGVGGGVGWGEASFKLCCDLDDTQTHRSRLLKEHSSP